MPKLIILDCDGTLTPSIKSFNHDAKSPIKEFCDYDRTGIKLLRARGDYICMLSGDPDNKYFAQNLLEIDFWYSKFGNKLNKLAVYPDLFKHYSYFTKSKDVYFISDDPIFDGPLATRIMEEGGKSFCPKNAHPEMFKFAEPLDVDAGHGVVMSVYFKLYPENYNINEFAY